MKNIGAFNPMVVMQNFQATVTENDFDPATINKELALLTSMVGKLERESENVGLLWYNKAYRAVDSTVIAPCAKYNLHIALPVAYASAVCLYWMFTGEKAASTSEDGKIIYKSEFDKARWIPGIVKNFLGILPRSVLGQPQEFNELGLGGKIETNKTLANSGHFTFGAALLAFSWAKISSTWTQTISPWISKKLSYTHNFLKGGAYLKQAARLIDSTEEVYFSDIVGLDHVKETFSKIVHYLENPEYYARRGLVPPKGILLVGGTRTGKSHSVKALFNEIKTMYERKGTNDPFRYISINASVINMAGGFEQLMSYVRHEAPCVIFIDEIDLLDLQRRGRNQMLSEFLTSLSGALSNDDPKKQVIVIAATNNPENLDHALRAAGRLGHELRYELPSSSDRAAFITTQLEKLSLDPASFNVARFAHETEGKSYEALKSVLNSAILNACIQSRVVDQQDIVDALDKELRNIVTIDNRVIPSEELLIVGSHFAGPALFLHLQNSETKLSKVTTHQVMSQIEEKFIGAHLWNDGPKKLHEEKRFEYGGFFTYNAHDTAHLLSYEQRLAQCSLYLSGFIAEETLLGASGYSCHKEYMDYALAIARSLAFEGMDADKLPDDIRTEYHRKALRIVEDCKEKLRILFKEHRVQLELIRTQLLNKQSLTGEEITQLLATVSENTQAVIA
jgi:ATP-dependent Zn protease